MLERYQGMRRGHRILLLGGGTDTYVSACQFQPLFFLFHLMGTRGSLIGGFGALKILGMRSFEAGWDGYIAVHVPSSLGSSTDTGTSQPRCAPFICSSPMAKLSTTSFLLDVGPKKFSM